MLSMSLGPIALPLAPVVLLLTVWARSWHASRLAWRDEDKARGELVQVEVARASGGRQPPGQLVRPLPRGNAGPRRGAVDAHFGMLKAAELDSLLSHQQTPP